MKIPGLCVAAIFSLVLGACHTNRSAALSPSDTGVLFRTARVEGVDRHFAVYVPREYSATKPWPCIVFLNGKGECGTDGSRQLLVGLLPAILAQSQTWPAIVVLPQKPDQESQWADHDALVMEALAMVRREFTIDPRRLYLTGLSQGGAGTWAIGAAHAEVWAALAPVCGYGDPAALAPSLVGVPIWAFHGMRDDVVTPDKTTAIIDAIKVQRAGGRAGPEPMLTLFPDANHNAWDPAYRGDELARWLFDQKK
jgi:predicted peptidase